MQIDPRKLLHPILLRSFVAVVEEQSFSAAAARINVPQPTISQHIVRLEQALARKLFTRTTRRVILTSFGETLMPIANSILASYELAFHTMNPGVLTGRVRLGASEGFALGELPNLLRWFTTLHSEVDLIVEIDSPAAIEDALAAGTVDLGIVECVAGEKKGFLLRRAVLEWYSASGFTRDPDVPVPVILGAQRSVVRELAQAALAEANLSWREPCSVRGYMGMRAAALAGLGAAPFTLPVRPGLEKIAPEFGLPELPSLDLVLVVANNSPAALELSSQLMKLSSEASR